MPCPYDVRPSGVLGMIRLFAAVEVPGNIKNTLGRVLEDIKTKNPSSRGHGRSGPGVQGGDHPLGLSTGYVGDFPHERQRRDEGRVRGKDRTADWPGIKWVDPSQAHLTLLFLGDQDGGTIPKYLEAFRQVASRGASFSMEMGGLDAFPSLGKPKVLFMPALTGGMEFSGLAQALAREASGAGLASGEEREIRAHLTLARLRDGKAPPDLLEDLRKVLSPSLGAFRVERFFLFQSRLRPSGAVHTKLGEIVLGKNPGTHERLDGVM